MNTNTMPSTRRNYLDWLRALLVLTVFIFHSLRFFDLEGWNVKSETTYLGVQILVIFISRWLMPVMFVISGMAIYYALEKRSPGRFLQERVLRLLIPLAVGLLTHIPLQGYLEAVSQKQYNGTFWQWYPEMLSGSFNWGGGHLWYLEILFLFSLICLPLFLWLRSSRGQHVLAWTGARWATPAGLYLVILPLVVLSATLNPDSGSILTSENYGGWNLPSHLLFFLSGYLTASSPAAQETILRLRRVSLLVGIGVFLVGAGLLFALTGGDAEFGSIAYVLWTVISSTTSWTLALAIFGYGMQHLNRRSAALVYAGDAAMPFYILHQSVLQGIAFYVLRWAIPDLGRWASTVVLSFALMMVLYEILIRRTNLMRMLFGMKPVSQEKAVSQPAVQVS